MITKHESQNGWRWVGVIVIVQILWLLWYFDHGPYYALSESSCCGKAAPQAAAPIKEQTEPVVQAPVPQELPVPAPSVPVPVPAVTQSPSDAANKSETATAPVCSGDMHLAVSFDVGSATLNESGSQQLDQIAACITSKTEVAGYTDNTGTEEVNNALSKARADAVVAYLTEKNPRLKDLVYASAHGSDHPIANNTTRQGRAKNRRIEFIQH